MITDLALRQVGESLWHVFPAPGGITGLCLLAESHLTVHTFPEHGALCLNLFCCTPRSEWDFTAGLREAVGAEHVDVKRVDRSYSNPGVPVASA
jgi:S-adenosylmethionine decarboxylase